VLRFILGFLGVVVATGLLHSQSPTANPSKVPGPRIVVHELLRLVAADAKKPVALEGDAVEGELGELRKETAGRGVRLLSGAKKDGGTAGAMAFTVAGLKPDQGRWYRLRVRGLVQEDFHVEKDEAFLRVEFFKDGGKNSLDHIKKSISDQIERERKDFADKGTNKTLGSATWRNYVVEFRTPFAEVDTLRLSVGFAGGAAKGPRGEFWISEAEILAIPDPADYVRPRAATPKDPPALSKLVKLGGRWYYNPHGAKEPPKQFDHTNADHLYYLTDKLETPFAGNMTAWLRKGYLERGSTKDNPKLVEEDRFVSENVVVSFTDKHLVIKSKNLPNHPTAVFPDRWRLLDGNPNYIQEQDFTWYIPLEPKENPKRIAMDAENKNQALPGGPIGVMTNGIIFHNPFDERVREDAVWRLDRCCGHPSPIQRYHYLKYPECINTPWDDQGEEHSPLIGFTFDGFPVYGPYEGKGILAKDSKTNPLNEFNVHLDKDRGWHYHVTPGKYPHLIGGFWGELETRNRFGPGPGGGPPSKKGPPKKKGPE